MRLLKLKDYGTSFSDRVIEIYDIPSPQITYFFPQSNNLYVQCHLRYSKLLITSSDAGSAGLIYLALLVLYSRQSERSRTPSGLARVSRWSFLAQSTVDSVSFAGHITFAILAEGRPSLTLIAPAFLACILFVYEAVSFLILWSNKRFIEFLGSNFPS